MEVLIKRSFVFENTKVELIYNYTTKNVHARVSYKIGYPDYMKYEGYTPEMFEDYCKLFKKTGFVEI